MITTHIEYKYYEIVVSKLDCVLARFPLSIIQYPDEFVERLEDLLKGLGQHVETHNDNS